MQASGWSIDGLRAAIRRAGRGYRRVVALVACVVVLVPVLIVALVPAVAADAVGLTERVPVVVQDVDRQHRVPDRPNRKPTWSVTVSWVDAEGARQVASDVVTSGVAPYRVGDRVMAGVYGDHVTLKPPGGAWWIFAVSGAFLLIGMVLAGVFWRRSRAWSSLPGRVGAGEPLGVTVTGAAELLRLRSSRLVPAQRAVAVPVRSDGPADDAVVFLLDGPSGVPVPGDRLDVWRGGGVGAARRRADGAWWVTARDSDRLGGSGVGAVTSGPAGVLGVVLVVVGAIGLAGGRWFLRDGVDLVGWSLSAAGLAGVIGGIVVLGRARARAKRSVTPPGVHPW